MMGLVTTINLRSGVIWLCQTRALVTDPKPLVKSSIYHPCKTISTLKLNTPFRISIWNWPQIRYTYPSWRCILVELQKALMICRSLHHSQDMAFTSPCGSFITEFENP